jgi:hypothetical protein
MARTAGPSASGAPPFRGQEESHPTSGQQAVPWSYGQRTSWKVVSPSPLNSVQQFVANIVNGIQVPTITKPIEAFITPPTVEDIDGPKAYIWGARNRGRRQTMPRGIAPHAGFKRLDWTVDIYLVYETTPDDPLIDQAFPLIIDSVLAKLWTTTMPQIITDPTSGQVSQIQSIGEEWELEYPPERTPATLRMIWYSSRIAMDVLEIVQA